MEVFLLALGAAIAWGIVYTVDQFILQTISPRLMLLIDAVLSIIVAVPFLLTYPNLGMAVAEITAKTWICICITFVVGTIASIFIFYSIQLGSASYASIFEISYPFFVVLFSAIVFRSVPNIFFFIGSFDVFGGGNNSVLQ